MPAVQGAAAATANIGQLAGMGTSLKQSVGDFAVQLQAAMDAVAAMEAQAAGAAAPPTATGKKGEAGVEAHTSNGPRLD